MFIFDGLCLFLITLFTYNSIFENISQAHKALQLPKLVNYIYNFQAQLA